MITHGLEIRGLKPLERRAIPRALSVLTDAFAGDPCLDYLLGARAGDGGRARSLHAYTVALGMRYGSVFTAGEDTAGIAIWLPPHNVHVSAWMFIRAGGLTLQWSVGGGILKSLGAYGDYSLEIHRRSIAAPHWYLLSLAVYPPAQGQGLGRALLVPALEQLDEKGLPCFLETHKEGNIPFYERFGFSVAREGRLPGTDRPHWALVRPAGGR